MQVLLLLISAMLPSVAAADQIPSLGDGTNFMKWAVDILLTLVLGLIAVMYRQHMKDYDKHKIDVEKRNQHVDGKFDGINQKLEDNMRKDDFQRMQASIHESIDRLRRDVTQYRTEDSAALAKTVNEIWEDVKDSRNESRRLSEEVWKQIEDTREKMNNHQIALARSYHTKDEISRLLDDKLDPMLSLLQTISKR
jgi:hypothetical protein